MHGYLGDVLSCISNNKSLARPAQAKYEVERSANNDLLAVKTT